MGRSKGELPRKEDGQKLYPLCNYERNKPKLYEIFNLARINAEESGNEIDLEEVYRIKELIDEFNSCVIEGTAYTTWGDGQAIKELLQAHSIRWNDAIIQEVDKANVSDELGWEEFGGDDDGRQN